MRCCGTGSSDQAFARRLMLFGRSGARACGPICESRVTGSVASLQTVCRAGLCKLCWVHEAGANGRRGIHHADPDSRFCVSVHRLRLNRSMHIHGPPMKHQARELVSCLPGARPMSRSPRSSKLLLTRPAAVRRSAHAQTPRRRAVRQPYGACGQLARPSRVTHWRGLKHEARGRPPCTEWREPHQVDGSIHTRDRVEGRRAEVEKRCVGRVRIWTRANRWRSSKQRARWSLAAPTVLHARRIHERHERQRPASAGRRRPHG